MGIFDIYCLVCAGPPSIHQFQIDDDVDDDTSTPLDVSWDDVQWLSNHVGVQEDIVPIDLYGYSSYGTFYTSQQQSRLESGSFHSAYTYLLRKDIPATDQHGLTCHKACYQFLHERLKYKLQFQEVWPLLIQLDNPSPSSQMSADSTLDDDYGGMTKYHGQHFDSSEMQEDGNSWMLLNPNHAGGEQNANRILNVWTPVVESFKYERRAKFHPMLVALYCSFHRAHQLAICVAKPSKQITLWTTMSAIPTSVVHLIAQKAEIAFV